MAKTLLLIEDSFTTQHVVQTAFAHDEIAVLTTTTLAEALQEMQHVPPDVIVADASLPEVDGFQLCQMIRDMEGLRHIPVVLLTSGLAAYDEAQGERTGVTGHLAKPFEAHALRQLVQQVLEAPSHTRQSPSPGSQQTSGSQEHSAQPSAAAQPERPDLGELDALMAQWTPLASSLATPADLTTAEALGRLMLLTIRDTVQTHLSNMLQQITPQILSAVQDIVARQAPELLEALLQREIDKLKQAVDADDRDGE